MADKSSTTVSFGGLFLIIFILIKLFGTSLATWSWWWVLVPIIPIGMIFIQRFQL